MIIKPSNTFHLIGSLVLIVAMLLIVISTRKDLSHAKYSHEALSAQNAALGIELAELRSELDSFTTGAPVAAENPVRRDRKVSKPVEVPESLFLQPPTVANNGGELTARFTFEPDENTELPDQITLVVRIPGDTDAKIVSLKPVAAPAYSNVEFLVNAQGTLGMIEGAPSELGALEFELTVSAPVKAIVRGSKGIKAFEIDITPTGCAVRKL